MFSMSKQIIDAEADTVEEARKLALSRMPDGFHQVLEKIVSDGKRETARASAETPDKAFADAKGSIPANAPFIYRVSGPPGTEIIKAVATLKPTRLLPIDFSGSGKPIFYTSNGADIPRDVQIISKQVAQIPVEAWAEAASGFEAKAS
jgi:hypothetical protein